MAVDPRISDIADQTVNEVTSAFRWGLLKKNLNPDYFLVAAGPLGWAIMLIGEDQSDNVTGLFKTIGRSIQQWMTTERKRAENNDPAYSWGRWFDRAKGLESDISGAVGLSWDTSRVAGLKQLAADLWSDAKTPFQPADWPWWGYALAGLVGLTAVAYIFGRAADVKRAFLGEYRHVRNRHHRRRLKR